MPVPPTLRYARLRHRESGRKLPCMVAAVQTADGRLAGLHRTYLQPDGGGKFTPNPATARKFFDPARTVHDSTNYEYAMTLWLQGLRHDPTSMSGLEGFIASSESFAAENPKLKQAASIE